MRSENWLKTISFIKDAYEAGSATNLAAGLAKLAAMAAVGGLSEAMLRTAFPAIRLGYALRGKGEWAKWRALSGWAAGEITGELIDLVNKQNAGGHLYDLLHPDIPATTPNSYRIVWIGGDPLALDLDGDGLETAAANGYSGALFDHNNDGIRTATGWIISDDGLLVRDLNGDGIINNGAELFGDSTLLANGTNARDGFVALRDIDSNGDGKVNAADTAFSELKIWRDINQDGISQADELKTLSELGIESLNTAAANTSISTSAGQQILTGSFTKTDGTTSTLADLNFTQDNFHSEYVDQIEIPEELQGLPDLQGMGRLRDLQKAAADGYELCAERSAA